MHMCRTYVQMVLFLFHSFFAGIVSINAIMKCSPHQSGHVSLSRPFCLIRLFITLFCREHNRLISTVNCIYVVPCMRSRGTRLRAARANFAAVGMIYHIIIHLL